MPLINIAYHADGTRLFDRLRQLPFSCWLDSGKPNSRAGRYDIMVAQPVKRWVATKEGINEYHYNHAGKVISVTSVAGDMFEVLENTQQTLPTSDVVVDLPFTGGIISYFSYDLGRELQQISKRSQHDCQLPDAVAGLYLWAIIQDHQLKKTWLVSLSDSPHKHIQHLETFLESNHKYLKYKDFKVSTLNSNTSEADYHRKIERITDYIQAGDCYQVNFSQCFSGHYQGDPYTVYREMRQVMASPFSAFMDLGSNQAVLSLSPERFIKIEENQIITQPIKGTTSRGKTPEIDRRQSQSLRNSRKNQAENLMIVDLLRNDLGKSCIPGSIQVPKLFDLESFPNVHHLVSTVTGTLADNKNPLNVFKHCFPGGSITGAPKKRAMEIIEELEDCQRSIYCGSISYISSNGKLDSNITIRTVACDGEKLFCWGGGGIVADSRAEDEYQESLTKIDALLQVLNGFKE